MGTRPYDCARGAQEDSGESVSATSRVGDRQANRAREKSVPADMEQVRGEVGVECRFGTHLRCSHAVTPWLIEHPLDILSKDSCRTRWQACRTLYERWEAKEVTHDTDEFGEHAHFNLHNKCEARNEQLERNTPEAYFLGKYWRSAERSLEVSKASIRLREFVVSVPTAGGMERSWNPEEDDQHGFASSPEASARIVDPRPSATRAECIGLRCGKRTS